MSDLQLPDMIRKAEAENAQPQLQRPPLYRVVMLNDDFTPMYFVIEMLMLHFHKTETVAHTMMLQIHHQGSALCGIFPRDIAETKIHHIQLASNKAGHPLRCIMECDGEN